MIDENAMNMEDYERQEELSRANQLFSESNNLQKRQLDQQEQLQNVGCFQS